MSNQQVFADLNDLAKRLRTKLENKKQVLIFAHNSIGKTRLSMAFQERQSNHE